MLKSLIIVPVLFFLSTGTSIAEAPNLSALEIKLQAQASDPLFNKIAWCESQNNELATNPESTAKGRFQWLDGSWKYYAPKLWKEDWQTKNVLNYQDNTDLSWFVYTTYGTRDWEADPKSYDCWKSEIPNGIYVAK